MAFPLALPPLMALVLTRPAVVDAHVHIAPTEVERSRALFEAAGVDWALNLSAGWPTGRSRGRFERQLEAARRSGRLLLAVNLPWRWAQHPRFTELAVLTLERAVRRGARALKVEKALGLGVVGPNGQRLSVDDPQLDPVWAAAGRLGLPVVIHTADPKAFWEAPTPKNERWAELSVHPGWSYFGKPGIPSFEALLAELERVIARHRNTTFVSVHFGNHAEDPWAVERQLETYPNLYVDIAARIVELGRHDPSRLRALFREHAERILFGTDLGLWPQGGIMLGSTGKEPDSDRDAPAYYSAHWDWLETTEEQPSPVPIQGEWSIHGLGLSETVLERIYRDNAEMLFGPPPYGADRRDRFPPYFRGLNEQPNP